MRNHEIKPQFQQIIDEVTNPWGVRVTLVEVKDVEMRFFDSHTANRGGAA